jgi:hypothetical protein
MPNRRLRHLLPRCVYPALGRSSDVVAHIPVTQAGSISHRPRRIFTAPILPPPKTHIPPRPRILKNPSLIPPPQTRIPNTTNRPPPRPPPPQPSQNSNPPSHRILHPRTLRHTPEPHDAELAPTHLLYTPRIPKHGMGSLPNLRPNPRLLQHLRLYDIFLGRLRRVSRLYAVQRSLQPTGRKVLDPGDDLDVCGYGWRNGVDRGTGT